MDSLTAATEGEKSAGQKITDTVSGSGGDAGKQGESVLDKAKDTLGLSAFCPSYKCEQSGQRRLTHTVQTNKHITPRYPTP